jgi:hypothetical protein
LAINEGIALDSIPLARLKLFSELFRLPQLVQLNVAAPSLDAHIAPHFLHKNIEYFII